MGVLIRKGIPYGGSIPQVQSDWDETSVSSAAYILNKPTALSDFTNDLNFITKTVNDLTNYYTKTQVDDFIDLIPKFKIKVVPSLLVVTDPNETTVYLVPSSDPESSNIYTEYVYVIDETTHTGEFEKIGVQDVDLSNYIQKSSIIGLIKNDGTIDGNKYIPKRESSDYGDTWVQLYEESYGHKYNEYIWTDGIDTYYSYYEDQLVLNKDTKVWENKTWSGLSDFPGSNIWTDGTDVYYSSGSDQYVLNKATSTWVEKTWNNFPSSFNPEYVWTDGEHVYHSCEYDHYELNKLTSTWVEKTWNYSDGEYLPEIYGDGIWSDGENIYYSGTSHLVLNKSTSTWSDKTWETTDFWGSDIWEAGESVYFSHENTQYELNKSTGEWIEKVWNGVTEFNGANVWTDNTDYYIYHEVYDSEYFTYLYVLGKEPSPLLRSDGSEDLNTYITSTDLSNYYTSAQTDSAIATAVDPLNKVYVWDTESGSSTSTHIINVLRGEESDPDYKVRDILVLKINRDYIWTPPTGATSWIITVSYNTSPSYVIALPGLQKVPKSDLDNNYFTENLKKGDTIIAVCIEINNGKPVFLVVSNSNSVDLTNYIQKSSTTGLVKNDGTIDTSTYLSIDEKFITKTWNGVTPSDTRYIWTDGENIYYSNGTVHKVLNKATSTWEDKAWTGLPSSVNANVFWSDGENVYYSSGSTQKVLNKSTSTWSDKTWSGLTSFSGGYIWSDGTTIYYSEASTAQKVLDKATSTWSDKTWTDFGTVLPYGNNVWSDGENIYYSMGNIQKIYDKTTTQWTNKTWNGYTMLTGANIWNDGNKVYFSSGTNQKVLDKTTSTWNDITWDDITPSYGQYVWSDGNKIYYSQNSDQFELQKNPLDSKQNISLTSPLTIGATQYTTVEGVLAGLVTQLNSLLFYIEQQITLSTSASTTVTFTDAKITANSFIEYACSQWDLVPESITAAAGSCTIVLPKVDSAQSVTVRIYVR